MEKDDILKPIQPCPVSSGQHFWLPVENKGGGGMQCFSCPMCKQRIYWSPIVQKWTKVTPREELVATQQAEKEKNK
jgi:hypothetical protein